MTTIHATDQEAEISAGSVDGNPMERHEANVNTLQFSERGREILETLNRLFEMEHSS
ncbi:MAG: hypothetical protein Tsb009_01700 [Planctomycetaceae bacterium]